MFRLHSKQFHFIPSWSIFHINAPRLAVHSSWLQMGSDLNKLINQSHDFRRILSFVCIFFRLDYREWVEDFLIMTDNERIFCCNWLRRVVERQIPIKPSCQSKAAFNWWNLQRPISQLYFRFTAIRRRNTMQCRQSLSIDAGLSLDYMRNPNANCIFHYRIMSDNKLLLSRWNSARETISSRRIKWTLQN